jgi:iron-sulfur cluster repair protein YtfE (RIC family)
MMRQGLRCAPSPQRGNELAAAPFLVGTHLRQQEDVWPPPKANHGNGKRNAPHRAKDAIALLKADHKEVKGMVEQFKKSRSESKKSDLAQQICAALEVHAQIEEEIFYPAAREALKANDGDLIDEAQVEHT